MKKIKFLLSVFLVVWNLIAIAQHSNQGIYMTSNDFLNNNLSFLPIDGIKYKFQLNELLNSSTIKITGKDSVYYLKKDSIFGYHDEDNTVYRYFEKSRYKILNPAESILLYSRESLGGTKNLQTTINYFFSANASSAPLPLTKLNIKNAFPNDSTFHEMLDMYFKNNSDLINYDTYYKMYKLNRALQFSQELNQKINHKQ